MQLGQGMRLPVARRRLLYGVGASLAASACGDRAPETASSAGPNEPPRREVLLPRKLGSTGEIVSGIGLGGFHIGKQSSVDESIRIIRSAVDRGITFLDNCWDYNGGQSEERMGRALEGGYRERAFLMTKIDGRTKRAATEQLEQSLRRLKTDRIDLVQIHEVIRADDPKRCFAEGSVEALVRARDAGKLRFIGFTGHKDPDIHLAMLDEANAHGFRFDAVQMPLNVLDHHFKSFEDKVLPVLLAQGIAVLGMKSLGGGDILRSGKVTATECLRYSLSLPASVVITGCDSMEILDQAVRMGQGFIPLTAHQTQALLARTREIAMDGRFEEFKTNTKYDGTVRSPHWLERAEV